MNFGIGFTWFNKVFSVLKAGWLGVLVRKRYGTPGTDWKGNTHETIVNNFIVRHIIEGTVEVDQQMSQSLGDLKWFGRFCRARD